MTGQITWDYSVEKDETGTKTMYRYTLEGINYKSSSNQWTVEAPMVHRKKPFFSGIKEIDINRSKRPPAFLFDQPYKNGSIVVVPFTAGLLVLDAKTGAQIQWYEYELDRHYLRPTIRGGYWFDDGTYSITCGKDTRKSDLVYSAFFLEAFKKYVLHFNGQDLYILNAKSGKLEGKVKIEKRWEKKARVYAMTSFNKLIVNWDGIIYR